MPENTTPRPVEMAMRFLEWTASVNVYSANIQYGVEDCSKSACHVIDQYLRHAYDQVQVGTHITKDMLADLEN